MRFRYLKFLLVAVGLIAALAESPAQATEAEDFIRKTGERALESLAGEDISDEVRERRFRAILNETFDVATIGRFVLGRHWRTASNSQRQEYQKLFQDFLVQAYAKKFRNWSGKTFRVGPAREINKRDKLVFSEVVMPEGRPIKINWRVRGPNSGYRIIDVMVEGVSMSVTQRDEFDAVIRNAGGKVEGLLKALRKKTGHEEPSDGKKSR